MSKIDCVPYTRRVVCVYCSVKTRKITNKFDMGTYLLNNTFVISVFCIRLCSEINSWLISLFSLFIGLPNAAIFESCHLFVSTGLVWPGILMLVQNLLSRVRLVKVRDKELNERYLCYRYWNHWCWFYGYFSRPSTSSYQWNGIGDRLAIQWCPEVRTRLSGSLQKYSHSTCFATKGNIILSLCMHSLKLYLR